MNGLDVSIVNFKNVQLGDSIFSAEFHSIEKVNALNKLKGSFRIKDFFAIRNEVISHIDHKSILYDLTHSLGNFLDDSEIVTEIHSNKKRGYFNDFVISRLRSYLREMAVVQNKLNDQLFSTEYLVYKNINLKLSPNSLMAFCLTKYVQTILSKSQYGTEHPRFYEFIFENLIIPDSVIAINDQITNIILQSHKKLEQAKQLYREAEQLLLKELGLLNFKPSNENISIRKLFDSFSLSGRLDSEYYQPKYDQVISKVKKRPFDKLGNIVNVNKSIEPGSEVYQEYGIPFVRVSNLSKFGITKTGIYLPNDFFSKEELKKLTPSKNTILLSKDGTVGIAYNIKQETSIITSGALLHLKIQSERITDILPEYLTLVLNSKVVQLQAEKDAGGSIIQHWKPSEIKEVLIPILDKSLQLEIEEKIKKSFDLKDESKRLLDSAKQAVEVAIEQSEGAAIKLLEIISCE